VTSLDELFQSLTQPSPGGAHTRFAVVPTKDDLRHLVGKDQNGFPAILVDASSKDGDTLLRVELEHLTVLPDVHCEVEFPDGKHRVGSYTLIRCSGDEELQSLFLRLVGGLLQQINPASERAELARVVVKLVDLFRALSLPPRKSVQGLWAELFLIAESRNPVVLLEAWHADPTELYDFSHEHQRLDVKSSSRRARVHTATLDQLYPPTGAIGVIASVVAQRAAGGSTVDELAEEITTQLVNRPDLQLKVRTIVTKTLGADWRSGARTRFDRDEAVQTCSMFLCEDVPRIALAAVPSGVTHIRFDVSLDDAQPQTSAALELQGGLLGAALPRIAN
jgi:hypothetical protein